MRRVGNLFERAFTLENLHEAFISARKGKRRRHHCYRFERRLAHELQGLHDELHSGTYRPRPYVEFVVHEPKTRAICAPAFRDVVVQHAIYSIVRPLFDRRFIDQSYACRPGRGTHAAADYAQAALQAAPRDSFTLQMDIRHFFRSIPHQLLRRLIECVIKDQRLVDVMMLFTDAGHGSRTGIPIGNLLCQLYALISLNPLDHFVKRVIGARWYCRYVDDFVIFGVSTRAEAVETLRRIEAFLAGMGFELSRWSIASTRRGANFVGYRTWAGKRFIRRRALYNFRRAVRAGRNDRVQSLLGHARRTHSLNYMQDFAGAIT